jgi:hypothetical protein
MLDKVSDFQDSCRVIEPPDRHEPIWHPHEQMPEPIRAGRGPCKYCDCPGYSQSIAGGSLCARSGCGHYRRDHRD